MIKIEIQNPCSCVKKRKSWMKELHFPTLEEAQQVAFEMCEQGNSRFCKKHSFEVITDRENITINTTKVTK